MRAMMFIGLGLVACLLLLAFEARTNPILDQRTLLDECSAFSQAGMRDCLSKKAQASHKILRQVEEKAASILSNWDDDNKYVNQAKAKLAASNKEFAKYRDIQCEFLASLSGGGAGNAHETGRLACIAELNSRRAEELDEAVHRLPLK